MNCDRLGTLKRTEQQTLIACYKAGFLLSLSFRLNRR
nr:MAG TPA: hypothetical protein [Caudoviricetes sp.]